MNLTDSQKVAFDKITSKLPLYEDEKPDKDAIITALIAELERIHEGWHTREVNRRLENLNSWESERYYYLGLLIQKSMEQCTSCRNFIYHYQAECHHCAHNLVIEEKF